MSRLGPAASLFDDGYFKGALGRILDLQRADGAIPWYETGVFDPWNHVEAAMALTVMGETEAAERAYRHLADSQLEDGSWWGEYGATLGDRQASAEGQTLTQVRDTNFCAYPATGLWHFYLCTERGDVLAEFWPVIERAMDFVLGLQSPLGDIRWAADDPQTPEDDALVTGCCSIYKSLDCAAEIAACLGNATEAARWRLARARLGHALVHNKERFDRTWPSKARFSMDWYYPVLAGVIEGEPARRRLRQRWPDFVIDGHGCRCVVDQPWITIAETAELVLALLRAGEPRLARTMLSWLEHWRDDNGQYYMGYQVEANCPWPDERPPWTAAAVILAHDAALGHSRACSLFLADGDVFARDRAARRERVRGA